MTEAEDIAFLTRVLTAADASPEDLARAIEAYYAVIAKGLLEPPTEESGA